MTKQLHYDTRKCNNMGIISKKLTVEQRKLDVDLWVIALISFAVHGHIDF